MKTNSLNPKATESSFPLKELLLSKKSTQVLINKCLTERVFLKSNLKLFGLFLLLFLSFNSYAQQRPFVTVWDLSLSAANNSNQIQFHATVATGGANYTWQQIPTGASGSGTLTVGESLRIISGLPIGARIRLSIEGSKLQRFNMSTNGDVTDPSVNVRQLVDVEQWGTARWNNMALSFHNCRNLNITAVDIPDLSGVQSMRQMFYSCLNLNGPANIGNWNTSNVTDMGYMFQNASTFNQPIGTWNTSKLNDLESMFSGASSFNQPIGNWNTSSATDMTSVFNGASSFNQPIGNWNTGNVTRMEFMFRNASSFNQPIGNWNTSKVMFMRVMFDGASSFNQPIDNWNTSKVTRMEAMFQNATYFNQPLDNWKTAAVTNMRGMFNGATAFNHSLGRWTLNANVDLSSMLNNSGLSCQNYSSSIINWAANNPIVKNRTLGAEGLRYRSEAIAARNQLTNQRGWTISDAGLDNSCGDNPFITIWDLSLASGSGSTQIQFHASVATGVTSYTWQQIPAGVSGSGTLAAGTALRTIIGLPAGTRIRITIFPSNLERFNMRADGNTQGLPDAARLTDVEQWGSVRWSTLREAFFSCKNLNISAIDIPDLSAVESISQMFNSCTKLNSPSNIDSWNTRGVKDMSGVFWRASSFNQPIGNWNTENVTDMRYMFDGASSFNQPIENWNISRVIEMQQMFLNANSFNQSLGNWNTRNVTRMDIMLKNAKSFNQSIGDWRLNSNVTLNNILNGSGISCENYSSTLIGLAANNPNVINRSLGASDINFGKNAIAARNQLTNERGWMISDAGLDVSCGCDSITARITSDGPTTFCKYDSVTLTASAGESYLWSTGDTTQRIVVTQAGDYSVLVAFNNGCTSNSNVVKISIIENIIPTVQISPNQTEICAGQAVLFTANANNGGSKPKYDWKVNDVSVQNSSVNVFSSSNLKDNDKVSCTLTSNIACASSTTANSNVVKISIVQPKIPIIELQYNADTLCKEATLKLIIKTQNLGTSTSYNWYKNGQLVGNENTLTMNQLSQNDEIWCSITTQAINCNVEVSAISDTFYAKVYPPTLFELYQKGDSLFATEGFVAYSWYYNNQLITKGTDNYIVPEKSGLYTVNITDPNGCAGLDASIDFVPTDIARNLYDIFQIYPNPTDGKIYLKFSNKMNGFIKIYQVNGQQITPTTEVKNVNQYSVDISKYPEGMYIITFEDSKNSWSEKIIKMNR